VPLSNIINSLAPTEVVTPCETTFQDFERITMSDHTPLPRINSSTQLIATLDQFPKPTQCTEGNLDCPPRQTEISEPPPRMLSLSLNLLHLEILLAVHKLP